MHHSTEHEPFSPHAMFPRAPRSATHTKTTMKNYQFALGTEPLKPLAAVPAIVEKMTGEKRHLTIVRKWTKTGIRGIVLPSVTIGGRVYTSEAAILWWIAATNAPEGASTAAPVAGQLSPAERAGLERVGVLPREAV